MCMHWVIVCHCQRKWPDLGNWLPQQFRLLLWNRAWDKRMLALEKDPFRVPVTLALVTLLVPPVWHLLLHPLCSCGTVWLYSSSVQTMVASLLRDFSFASYMALPLDASKMKEKYWVYSWIYLKNLPWTFAAR